MEGAGQTKVEVGKIDRDENVRPFVARHAHQTAVDRKRPGQDRQRLRQSGDGQAAVVRNQLRPAGLQPVGAETVYAGGGVERPNLAGKRAGIQIARRLAACQQDLHLQWTVGRRLTSGARIQGPSRLTAVDERMSSTDSNS